jgi:hypothetical protein
MIGFKIAATAEMLLIGLCLVVGAVNHAMEYGIPRRWDVIGIGIAVMIILVMFCGLAYGIWWL